MNKIYFIVFIFIGTLISCDSPKEVKLPKNTDPLELEKESILVALEQTKTQVTQKKESDSFKKSGEATPPVYQEFRNPPERAATAGFLNTELKIAYNKQQIWNVKMQKSLTVNLRNYEGMLVGPTLRVSQGDLMRVKMNNQLPPLGEVDCNPYKDHHQHTSDGDPCDQKNPESFNTTNLHTHGLHVSPKDSSDNVLASVDPTCSFQNHIQLPENHPQGTFWYHGHIHGSTAVQVSSGMAGALIVEGGMDTLPEIKAAEEKIFVLQQVPYTYDKTTAQWSVENFDDSFGPGTWAKGVDSLGWRTVVNGQTYPIITMKSGEVQYWRFIHAGVRETIDLQLDGHNLNQIAMDGISLGRIEPKGHVELQPGYRSDILIKAETVTEPKTIFLYDKATPDSESLLAETESPAVLAIIKILPEVKDMPLPTNEMLAVYPPFKSIPDSELDAPQQDVWFNISGSTPCFTVNDKPFSMENPPRKLTLGTASEWLVTSKRVNHPFHIHVNSFEITKVIRKNGEVEVFDPPIWKDTYLIQQDDSVYFRSRYEDFDGKFVLHCHILDHEDQGMMEMVEIVEAPGI